MTGGLIRVALSQSVGLVGLVWCLFDRHPIIGLVLSALVFADQAVFLRGVLGLHDGRVALRGPLVLCGLAVGLADVLLLIGVLFEAAGLRVIGSDTRVTDPLDFLAFALATVLRLGVDLAPVGAGGRLLAAAAGLFGTALLMAVAAALVAAGLRRAQARRDRAT